MCAGIVGCSSYILSSIVAFYPPERPPPCGQHQPTYHISNRSSKIPRTALRLQGKLARTHRQKKKTNRLQNKTDQVIDTNKIPSIYRNKLLVYQAVIKPTRSYGIELWSCSSKSNRVITQRSQSRTLRATANAPRASNKSYSTHILQLPFRK